MSAHWSPRRAFVFMAAAPWIVLPNSLWEYLSMLGRVLINAGAMSAFGVIADVAWASRTVREW